MNYFSIFDSLVFIEVFINIFFLNKYKNFFHYNMIMIEKFNTF